MTILDAYQKVKQKLIENQSENQINLENPPLEARILIMHALQISISDFIKKDTVISKKQWLKINHLVAVRLKRTNIDLVIKKKAFYEKEFSINKQVLIPRPETEILIEKIIESYSPQTPLQILDIGTGTGNIAITLADHFPQSKIEAIDISKKALKTAEKNRKKYQIDKKKILFIKKNLFHYSSKKKFDIIVSNPPYITTKETMELINNQIISDPVIALDGGEDGLLFYHQLFKIGCENLKINGKMFLEHGIHQREKIVKIFNKNPHFDIFTYNDYSNIDRIIVIENKKK